MVRSVIALAMIGFLQLCIVRFDLSMTTYLLVGILGGWTYMLRRYLPPSTAAVLAVAIYFALNILLYLTPLVTHRGITLPVSLVVHTAILGVGFMALRRTVRPNMPSGTRTSYAMDAFIVISAVAVALFVLLPFLHVSAAERINMLSMGEDNVSHFALHHSIVESGTLAYQNNESGLISALRYYPQGLHAFYASNTHYLYGTTPTTQQIITSHILQITLTYVYLFVMILLIIKTLLLELVDRVQNTRIIALTWAALSPFAFLYIGLGFMFYLFTFGFHSQIAAYALALLPVLLLTGAAMPVILSLAILCLLLIAVSFTWFFVLPIAATGTMVYIFLHRKRLHAKQPILAALVLGLVGGAVALMPIIIDQRHSHGGGGLLLGGAVWKIQPIVFVMVTVMGCVVPLLYDLPRIFAKRKLLVRPTYLAVTVLLAASFAFSMLIGAYQVHKIHQHSYYYYKSLYLVVVLLAMLASITAIHTLSSTAKTITGLRQQSLFFLIIAGFGLAITAYVKPSDYVLAYKNRTLTTYLDSSAIRLAIDTSVQSDVLYPDSCQSYARYMTTRWVGSILLNDNDARHIYATAMLNDTYGEQVEFLSASEAVILQTANCDKPLVP